MREQPILIEKAALIFIISNLTPSNRFRAECNRFRAGGK